MCGALSTTVPVVPMCSRMARRAFMVVMVCRRSGMLVMLFVVLVCMAMAMRRVIDHWRAIVTRRGVAMVVVMMVMMPGADHDTRYADADMDIDIRLGRRGKQACRQYQTHQ